MGDVSLAGIRLRGHGNVQFTHSGRYLVTTGSAVSVWEVETGKEVAKQKVLKNTFHLAIADDDSKIAVKNTAGAITLCSLPDLTELAHYKPRGSDEGCRIQFLPGGEWLADGTWNGQFALRSATDLSLGYSEALERFMIDDLSIAPETGMLAMVCGAGWGHPLFQQPMGDFVSLRRPPWHARDEVRKIGLQWRARSAQFSNDGRFLACIHGLKRTVLKVVDLADDSEKSIELAEGCFTPAWSPDGSLLALPDDHGINFYSRDLDVVATYPIAFALTVSFAPNGELIGVGADEIGTVLATVSIL